METTSKINILISDAQYIIRAGLKFITAQNHDLEIIDEVIKKETLFKKLNDSLPSLLIVDHLSTEGFDLKDYQLIVDKYPELPTLVISMDNDKQNVSYILERGVNSFLTKNCSESEIKEAIYATAKGEKFICNTILNLIWNKNSSSKENCDPSSLTKREIEIIKLIGEAMTTKEMAQKLYLSHHTINTHRKNIMKKLGLRSPIELILYGINTGLIKVKKM